MVGFEDSREVGVAPGFLSPEELTISPLDPSGALILIIIRDSFPEKKRALVRYICDYCPHY